MWIRPKVPVSSQIAFQRQTKANGTECCNCEQNGLISARYHVSKLWIWCNKSKTLHSLTLPENETCKDIGSSWECFVLGFERKHLYICEVFHHKLKKIYYKRWSKTLVGRQFLSCKLSNNQSKQTFYYKMLFTARTIFYTSHTNIDGCYGRLVQVICNRSGSIWLHLL